jgi:peptidoglycan hydrolase-like protein with peptidoglycan-binding domain
MQALDPRKTVMLEATTNATLKKPLLLRGFQGAVVVELQKLLTYRESYTGSLNGIFDTPLENAVKAFQHRVFLEEDGIVGQLTWQALYTGMPVNMPLLTRGSVGQNVVRIQESLKASRIYSATIDGIFGRITEVSVQGFQKRWGLVADGVVGPHTWLALSKVPH